jgi:hypothetical protein
MGVNHTLIRNSENFKGLDKRSSDLARTREYATDMLNATYRKTGAINKRKGFKINVKDDNNFYGASSLKSVSPLDGAVSEEIIAVNDSRIYKLLDFPFNIAYEGVSDVYVSLIPQDTAFRFQVRSQDSLLLDQFLGTGLAASDLSVGDLKSTLNNLQFTIATIPDTSYVTNVVEITPFVEYEYYVNIPYSSVSNNLAIKVGTQVKINNETQPANLLTIETVNINYDVNEEITSYSLVLRGASFILSNLATQGAGVELNLNEANDINVTVDAEANNLKAALMDLIVETRLEPSSVGGVDLFVKTWEELQHGNTYIHTNDQDHITWEINNKNMVIDSELENASFAQINNVMYISNGYNELLKYDGEYVYSAGLPNSDIGLFSIPEGTDVNRRAEYRVVYEYTDFKGNIITSQPSASFQCNTNTSVSHTTTITWTVGDFNGPTGIFSTKDTRGTFNANISTPPKPKHPQYDALPATSDNNDEKIRGSKRLRVKIYRSKSYKHTSPDFEVVGQYYLIADLPYDQGTFTDTKEDDDLNVFLALVDPIKRHDPPPKGKYVSIFKNCLVSAGDPTNVNNVRYSLPANASTGEIGSEYFPDDENGVVIDSPFGDKITAIAPLRDLLYVFHSNSISVMGGQINLLEQPVSELLTREGGIGCVSFHSIQEVKNTLFFLSEQGIYSINASNAVQEASSLINTLFVDKDLKKKRTITVNWTNKDLIIMQIPKEDVINLPDQQLTYTVEGSLVVVYDYYRDAWLKWDNIDMTAAGIVYKNNLSFISRSNTGSTFNTMSTSDTRYDFTDHTDAIDFEYETNWESMGEPTIPKKFLRLKIYAFDTDKTFESPGFNLLTGIQKNYIDANLGEINFDFDSLATAGWGIPPWGEFGWGNSASPFLKSKLISGKTRSLKLKFTNNTQNENVLITNYEMEIASPFGMEIKD